jgi:hypothetical protein
MKMSIVISPLTVAAYDAALQVCVSETGDDLPAQQLRPALRAIAAPGNRPASMRDVACGVVMSSSGQPSAKKSMRATAGCIGSLMVLLTTVSMLAQAPIAAAPAKAAPAAKRLGVASDPAASSLESYLLRVRLDNKAVQSSTARSGPTPAD